MRSVTEDVVAHERRCRDPFKVGCVGGRKTGWEGVPQKMGKGRSFMGTSKWLKFRSILILGNRCASITIPLEPSQPIEYDTCYRNHFPANLCFHVLFKSLFLALMTSKTYMKK